MVTRAPSTRRESNRRMTLSKHDTHIRNVRSPRRRTRQILLAIRDRRHPLDAGRYLPRRGVKRSASRTRRCPKAQRRRSPTGSGGVHAWNGVPFCMYAWSRGLCALGAASRDCAGEPSCATDCGLDNGHPSTPAENIHAPRPPLGSIDERPHPGRLKGYRKFRKIVRHGKGPSAPSLDPSHFWPCSSQTPTGILDHGRSRPSITIFAPYWLASRLPVHGSAALSGSKSH